MSKIIIDNRTQISDQEALQLVERVVQKGMISESAGIPKYCHGVTFYTDSDGVIDVGCRDRRKNDDPHSFVITARMVKGKA